MAAVDLNAKAFGVPRRQLMESSGNAVTRACRDLTDPGASVAVIAGHSNNGGDTLVAAWFLKAYDVTAHLLGRPETISTDITHENWSALVASEANHRTVTDSVAVDLGSPDLIVDAMLNTGVIGTLREPKTAAARAIDESSATVLAVDMPSGVDVDTGGAAGLTVDADRVITFHDDRPGLGDLDCEVVVVDIGIPEAAELFTGSDDLLALNRDVQSHRDDHGDILVVGGGPYTGTPALTAQPAFRAGADLACIACPEGVTREVQGYSRNLIIHSFSGDRLAPEHVPDLLGFTTDRGVVVFGPGFGDIDGSLDAVHEFLATYDEAAVVDADALQVVPEVETGATLICTPHQGELRKMGGETDAGWETRSDLVREFAADLDHALLMEGAYDMVSDGDAVRASRTEDPGMTVGGTGDMLAGAIGALTTVLPPLDAAAVAAYTDGRAGGLAADEFGGGLVTIDLLERLPIDLRGDDE